MEFKYVWKKVMSPGKAFNMIYFTVAVRCLSIMYNVSLLDLVDF